CQVTSVKCDTQNNIVATGYFYGTFNFGGKSLSSINNSYDIFAAKYNYTSRTSLALGWANSYGGSGSDGATSIALDSTGHLVITGYFGGTANFGGATLLSAGSSDVFLMQLNP